MTKNENYHLFVDIPEGNSGSVEVIHQQRAADVEMMTANARTMMFTGAPQEVVSYPFATRWHKLEEEGIGTWMTDDPIEQAQHRRCLEEFRGTVLVAGLGLGIAVKMLAEKKGVERIVVVEKSKDVIDLVFHYLGRDVERKATAYCDTIESYLANCSARFDWAFIDTWQSDGETTLLQTVIPLRELAYKREVVRTATRVICWNEDTMRGQLYTNLISRYHSNSDRLKVSASSLSGTKHEGDFKKLIETMPSLNFLATTQENIWFDWSVPFFQWLEFLLRSYTWAQLDEHLDHIEVAARTYADWYGYPGFEIIWDFFRTDVMGLSTGGV